MTTPSIKEALELKPCPFCGGTDICSVPSLDFICCRECHVTFEDAEPSAVECWNTRATLSPPAGERRADLERYIPDIVKNAMLTMWNDICADTGCHPLDLEHGSRKNLTFTPRHWAEAAGKMVQQNIHDLYSSILPAGERREAIDPDRVKEAMEDGKGFWKSCSGCHETNEGYPTGAYSVALKCHLGFGCSECGGIGAVWDNTDYSDYEDNLASGLVQDEAGWRDISTAPKDGRYIVVGRFRDDELKWVKHSRWMSAEESCEVEGGASADDYDAGWTDGDDEGDYCYPTHWLPLPAPPIRSARNGSEV